ncbi:hypothetical protein [Macrococcus brunensis]|uniref:hypothetical protein n=1 Tax=Macrococcus brunensis TaxID=198483 RepID=UPI001EF09180|nr:hypothetical protein [Macrococcus brunensis]ULG71988.1 hypothetical protein MGG12_00225 [Macrococcus brunensis]
MLRRLLKWILEDESRGVELYPDTLKIEEGIITDADEQLICIEAHGEDIENIFRELMKDRKFEAMIDGFGVYVDRENIDLEDGEEPGYFLTVLLDKENSPILIWDPISGKLSYNQSIQSYIKLSNKDFNPPYLLPVQKDEVHIVGPIIYSGDDAYLLEMDDEYRELLLIKTLKPKQSIFIKGKKLMQYILEHHIPYCEKFDHILFDYELDIHIIKDLMNCTCNDGYYNVQGIYFLDEQLDLNTVHFESYRKTFIVEIRDERAFYISVSSDDSYAFNLNRRV